ncbi:MAG: polysulfide reductase NrfD [Thiobacillaceae bacterium]|nr:polysulfide reductase NrfD [Thiobacillaceae bacterium]MCX7673330.1 polysulfide reductase NrfD [Thiobacillaceae bacterium]MDW8322710.1 NrfD/PsrC family molybdoenzyme membrane anchor subunit [Burkholderiales bacterium]
MNGTSYALGVGEDKSALFWTLLALGGLVLLGTLYAFFTLEHHGHALTGMDNQIVWGLPHVFAVFLIVAASGVLNVASIGSVFGKKVYKARAPLSGLLALAMMVGGLAVLVLDLGRPERLTVALTHYNFKSIFALNMIFYNGFFAIVGLYLLTLMDRKLSPWSKPLGILAFLWRLALTTATGSIFGFIVARAGFNSALYAPMFILYSFTYGMAVFMVVQSIMYKWNDIQVDARILAKMKNLLAIFIAASLYFTAVLHLTNLYYAKQWEFERFILLEGGVYTWMFWAGQVLLGGVLPLILLFSPLARHPATVFVAALLVILGGHCQMYVTIIGGQAFPLDLFPGWAESSSFYDGQIHPYTPTIWELLLGLGGIAIAFLITTVAVRVLGFLPQDDLKALEPELKAG